MIFIAQDKLHLCYTVAAIKGAADANSGAWGFVNLWDKAIGGQTENYPEQGRGNWCSLEWCVCCVWRDKKLIFDVMLGDILVAAS